MEDSQGSQDLPEIRKPGECNCGPKLGSKRSFETDYLHLVMLIGKAINMSLRLMVEVWGLPQTWITPHTDCTVFQICPVCLYV